MKLFQPVARVLSAREFQVDLSFEWRGERRSWFVKYTSTRDPISPNVTTIDALACVLCPMAVANGAIISSQAPMDEQLLGNLKQYAKLWNTYNLYEPKLDTIQEYELHADMPATCAHVAQDENKRVYSSFSAGVDSFHTLYSNMSTITDLVCVFGCDITLSNKDLLNMVKPHMEDVGRQTGKNVIFVETNARDILEFSMKCRGNQWGCHYHGPLFFSFVHLIAGPKTYLFPSTYTRDDYVTRKLQWGSSPDADPLFSSALTKIVHFGTETRFEKVKYLMSQPLFSQHVRVCWENNGDWNNPQYNCGKCPKCKRLLASLFVLLYHQRDELLKFAACFPHGVVQEMSDEKAIEIINAKHAGEDLFLPQILKAYLERK